jgi:hypothetical protein
MTYSIPRLVKDQQNKYSIVFYVDGKRFRVSNGKKFGVPLSPNNLALTDREHAAEELRLCISIALKKGWGQRSNAQSTLPSSIQGRGNMPEAKETYRRSFSSTMNRLTYVLVRDIFQQRNIYERKNILSFKRNFNGDQIIRSD